ncbi:MAG: hypothetical protein NC253_09285 [Ruminococcus sp.]|nr:hypothetical protein [Ruminococcus sp.]MCM1480345.1 hypothetical protein [Muribaculaceae bacterium]
MDKFRCFENYGFHKGFYNDKDTADKLFDINYSDFFTPIDDDEFPYDNAYPLLCGSCHIFALSLKEILDYNPYIIEEKNGKGFHVFCQIYKNRNWYYIDARGITSSFDEFMTVAKEFVNNEYIIRPVDFNDIDEWESDTNYDDEAYAFSKAIIQKYKGYYTLE